MRLVIFLLTVNIGNLQSLVNEDNFFLNQKNKNYQRNRKKYHDEDKILTVLGFTFHSKKDNFEPKKTVDAFDNNRIQYECKEDKEKH